MTDLNDSKSTLPLFGRKVALSRRPSTRHPGADVVLYAVLGDEYATWIEKDGARFWGHYFTSLEAAQYDFATRGEEVSE